MPIARPPVLSRRSFGIRTASLAAAALAGGGTASAATVNRWATGGTAAMAATYPDPFTIPPTTCPMVCALTRGPCYTANAPERRDVSEGVDGLPVRLALLVVDEGCEPVDGLGVDLWHAAPVGLYSGEEVPALCTRGDPEATTGQWFRGIQTSGADGRVDFDTCFPGWYPRRTVHLHLQLRRGGDERLTTQLVFDQDLVDEIYTTHPAYLARGLPDTSNTEDFIVRGDIAGHQLETRRMSDGVMQAWKVLVIR